MRVLMVHCRYQIRGGEDECFEAEQRLLRAAGVEVDTYEDDNRRVEQLGALRTGLGTVWSQSAYGRSGRSCASSPTTSSTSTTSFR